MTEQDAETLPLGEAARRLGLTTDALRMRFRRGKIGGFRRAGRIFVILPGGAGPEDAPGGQAVPPSPAAAAELARLAADNVRLHEQQDRLLRLLEREQVLRQQLQTQLVDISGKSALTGPPPELADLARRLGETESNFDLLKRAVSQLVRVVEGRG